MRARPVRCALVSMPSFPSRHWRALAASLVVACFAAIPASAASSGDQVVASFSGDAFAGRSHVRTVTLPRAAGEIVLRVRRRCGRGTTVRLTVDRRTVISRSVAHRRFRPIAVRVAVSAGRHRVALTSSGGKTPHCRRPLATGAVRFSTAARSSASSPFEGSAGIGGISPSTVTAPRPVGTETGADAPPASPPAADAPARPKLAWAPPALSAPTTITVAQGDRRYSLDTGKDYIIKLGSATHAGGLTLSGGRNIVIVGGRIAPPASSSALVGLLIAGAVGTVHAEGIWFDGSSGHEFDAVQIDAPKATVQLENLRATGLRGSYDTNHTDIVQPWGGVAKLRVDRLTGTSNYQGIFTQPDLGPIGSVDLRHIDLAYDDVGARTGGYLMWLSRGCNAPATWITNVYVKGRPGSTLGSTVWPPPGMATQCGAVLTPALAIAWPVLPISGVIRWGSPPSGSFVTPPDAGSAYKTPGYE
jgi:hypothetical protein